jgi:hypothetical protein
MQNNMGNYVLDMAKDPKKKTRHPPLSFKVLPPKTLLVFYKRNL